jgi:hypothetical protein
MNVTLPFSFDRSSVSDMNKTCTSLIVAAWIALFAFAPAARLAAAEPQAVQFLHALQQNGYSDMAVEYLRMLAKQGDLPAELQDVWELEMSKSLQGAAELAATDRQYDRLIEESQRHLAKFLEQHPNHPAAAVAVASAGELLGKKAEQLIESAKAADKDPKEREREFADARADLGKAAEKFKEAQKKLETQLAEAPLPADTPENQVPRAKALEARAALEAKVDEIQLKRGLADYYLAQTYTDPNSEDRKAALGRAAGMLDGVFQRERAAGDLPATGMLAHMWHGRVAEELGDLDLAKDLYDEVLAQAPQGQRTSSNWDSFFAQVDYFRLRIIAKQDPQQFLSEAARWLLEFRRWKHTDGFQGVALELAKAKYAQAEEAAGPAKVACLSEARKFLADVTNVRGPYQREARALRRKLIEAAGNSDAVADTFDDAVALAEMADAGGQWQQAEDAYQRALKIAEKTNLSDEQRIAAVRESWAHARLMVAQRLYDEGKWQECIVHLGGIVSDGGEVRTGSPAAARASALGVRAQLRLYAGAATEEKPAALEKLMKVAEFTERHWPDSPAADDARIARGQAKLVVDQVRDGIGIFERVNPTSERYLEAMYFAGRSYASLYLGEKPKPGETGDRRQAAADRAKAIERLTQGFEAAAKQIAPGQPFPAFYLETQLLLAELRREGNEMKEAAALYESLVDAVASAKPRSLDETTIDILLGAVRTFCALGDLERAGEAGNLLIELGPDTPQVNAHLIELARLLQAELENSTKAAQNKAGAARLAALRELLGKTLLKLSGRKQMSAAAMAFLGDGLGSLGKTAEASQVYQAIIERAESDPEFAKAGQRVMTRVRARLVGLLRQQGKSEEALDQVNRLIKDNPAALEPMMEKGRILEDMADQDPAYLDAAIAHWTGLRTRLQAVRGAKKPDEYFDVIYRAAACLVRQADDAQDKATAADRARKAEQVLTWALIEYPKLNGAEAVARYQALKDKARQLQGQPAEPSRDKK